MQNLAAFVKKRDPRLEVFNARAKAKSEARQAREKERLAEEKRKVCRGRCSLKAVSGFHA